MSTKSLLSTQKNSYLCNKNAMTNIAIIGGGNLGTAIAEGLAHASNEYKIAVSRRKIEIIQFLSAQGITLTSNNADCIQDCEIIILAVKPKQVSAVLTEIRDRINSDKQILISVATGVSINEIEEHLGFKMPIFRAMPNTAVAIRESMTCISSRNSTVEQRQQVVGLFDELGKAILIEENLMEASTVLGACGIAYALRFIRASMQGGIEIGFDSKTSLLIAAQTVKGAAELLLQGGQHPESEIDKVTTPQGCTIAGLNEMEHQGFSSSLIKGIATSFHAIDKIKK
jgi:pyrroline-5-carboxylate reductase